MRSDEQIGAFMGALCARKLLHLEYLFARTQITVHGQTTERVMSAQAHWIDRASPQGTGANLLNPAAIRQLAKSLLTATLLFVMASTAIAVKVATFVPRVWQ